MDARAQVRQFRAYLRASERLMTTHGMLAKMDTVAQGVVESGLFGRCVVRVYRRRFSSRPVLGAAGVDAAARAALTLARDVAPEICLALTARAQHLGGDGYYLRGKTLPPEVAACLGSVPAPPGAGAGAGEAWEPGDLVLAHLYSSRRVLLGHLVADEPWQGRLPDEDGQRSFVLFASLAARLLDQELRLRTDPMTDAFNGNFLDTELDRLGEEGQTFAAVFADMDGLKDVNDRFGHLMGDRYIRVAHDILLEHLPEDGLLYRPYGDEFVYLREADDPAPVAARLAPVAAGVAHWNESVRPTLAGLSGGGGMPPPLELSVGMAHGGPSDAQAVVRAAEAAMYEEKNAHHQRTRSPGPGG